MVSSRPPACGATVAFLLVYLTFFLDNVLLTVLVPIIPDWVREESLALWAMHDAPLVKLLNTTMRRITAAADDAQGIGSSQAMVGCVLGAKAAAQLLTAPAAATLVSRRGPAVAVRLATALLAVAAAVFAWCARRGASVWAGVWAAGAGRALHGAGAALAAVGGLALVAAVLPSPARGRAVGALLGAVAAGVLVGYPFGGAAYALWSPAAPFQLLCVALLADLGLQYALLDTQNYYQSVGGAEGAEGAAGVWAASRGGAARACAGAVVATTAAMAALEPALPLWLRARFAARRWHAALAFLPDSVGYLVATAALGGAARALGAERVALAGQAAVGLAALALPHATTLWAVAAPQLVLGAGLGATDAALVPALLARRPRRAPQLAALLQAASSAAYFAGPVVGGALSWAVGFESTLRTLGVANLLYAALLYRALARHPLSHQWGATTPDDDSEGDSAELTPLR